MRLWSKALTDVEAKAYYECTPHADEAGLYAAFKLNEGAGSLLYSGSSPSVQMKFSGAALRVLEGVFSAKVLRYFQEGDFPPGRRSAPLG